MRFTDANKMIPKNIYGSTYNTCIMQIGIGMLILQQLTGANGVLFYSSTIFASAGEFRI